MRKQAYQMPIPQFNWIFVEPEMTLAERIAEGGQEIRLAAADPHDSVIVSFACMVKAMIPLLTLLVSDEFTPAERRRAARSPGNLNILNLKEMLDRLTDEDYRAVKMDSVPTDTPDSERLFW